VSDHEKVAKMFDIVKKKVSEVNHRLKPLQDQIRKWKTELDKTQTSYKSKVNLSIYRRISIFFYLA
jgi:flagellar capping protein FliD